ncbi:MAG: cytochrome c oxidase cbb3-type subunit [Verrucomicrobiota bacterium]|jgi:cbb3-type cytochrome oxidase cytochrome c subunit
MKGIVPLFLGIFGTFAFSWVGLTLIPNYQIGHLDPQVDEEGNDPYPAPKSGMADRGRKIYAANGCVYCHSQQVRADYAASDIERKWGVRRSAPRDYLFDRPVLLGKMRVGPDLSNIGKRAPVEDENAAPPASTSPAPSASSGANPPAPASGASPAAPPATSPAASPNASASPKAVAANSPAPAPTNATTASVPAAPANPSASPAAAADANVGPSGGPPMYSEAWHHLHLYSPRSLVLESNMPAYHFLYEKRRISGERANDALKLTGPDAPEGEWEIVPTYDAKCLVAFLLSLDQSHDLKEAKLTAAPASSPAPAASPAPAKEEKK